jgi:protein BCP1
MNQKRDVYGVTTILSLSRNKDKEQFLGQIFKYVVKNTESHADGSKLKSLISSKNVGLLVNERLVNIPALAVPNMHAQLPDDLSFTKEQDDIEDPKEFNYDYLLVLSKFTVPNELVGKGKEIPKR